MNRYFIELAYKGTNYHGWQVQPGAITVQEVLKDNMSKVLREDINLIGAGRTDTGVHASFFVAHFDLENQIQSTEQLTHKLNCMLPKDIAVFRVYSVGENCHARFDAISRTYKYFVSTVKNPFSYQNEIHYTFPLDIETMNIGAELLYNYIDFTSFSKLHTQVKTNNCKVEFAHWEQRGNELVFTIRADRFLRNMVRAVVGSLFDLGRGRTTLEDFRNIIEAKDRGAAGASAPPQALYLYDIQYPQAYGVVNPQLSFGKTV